MARNIRITAVLATLVTASALAVPALAHAWSIHSFKIRDAGPEIVAKVTVCTSVAPGYEVKYHFRVHVETREGWDKRNVDFTGWYGRGCTEGSNVFRDTLRYDGWYLGRVKVRLSQTDDVRQTRWRRFFSSGG
jgi:hypothetical protein